MIKYIRLKIKIFWKKNKLSSYYQRFKFVLKNDGYIKTIIKLFYFLFFFKFSKINLDKIKISFSGKTLDEIFFYFGTDKANFVGKEIYKGMKSNYQGHNYSIFYEQHFNKLRKEKLKILELGVQRGFSSASFYHYFQNSEISCIDIDKHKILYTSSRISNFEINLRDKSAVKKFTSKYKNYFDIIIDDASHFQRCIIENLNNFHIALKPQSYYVIEDYNQPEIFPEKMDCPNEPNISKLLQLLRKKNSFKSDLLEKNSINFFIKNLKSIHTHKGNKPESTIAFIKIN